MSSPRAARVASPRRAAAVARARLVVDRPRHARGDGSADVHAHAHAHATATAGATPRRGGAAPAARGKRKASASEGGDDGGEGGGGIGSARGGRTPAKRQRYVGSGLAGWGDAPGAPSPSPSRPPRTPPPPPPPPPRTDDGGKTSLGGAHATSSNRATTTLPRPPPLEPDAKPTPMSSFAYHLPYSQLDLSLHPWLYRPGRGGGGAGRGTEQGVLLVEPYKSALLPLWRFKTAEQAQRSAELIGERFDDYVARGDFVGADMARKFLQMLYTRSKRYVYNGGRIYAPTMAPSPRARRGGGGCASEGVLDGRGGGDQGERSESDDDDEAARRRKRRCEGVRLERAAGTEDREKLAAADLALAALSRAEAHEGYARLRREFAERVAARTRVPTREEVEAGALSDYLSAAPSSASAPRRRPAVVT